MKPRSRRSGLFVDSTSSLTLERITVHISDDTDRIAILKTRTFGTDASEVELKRFIYSNHLQSTSLELDGNGDIISYEEYHPYGTTSYQAKSATINATAKRYRYTGKERDDESGLNYHGARYYALWLCRWISVDPISSEWYNMLHKYNEFGIRGNYLEQLVSSYNYCDANPVLYHDLNGEFRVTPKTAPPRVSTSYIGTPTPDGAPTWQGPNVPPLPATTSATPNAKTLANLTRIWGRNVVSDQLYSYIINGISSGKISSYQKDGKFFYETMDGFKRLPIPYSRTQLLHPGDPGYNQKTSSQKVNGLVITAEAETQYHNSHPPQKITTNPAVDLTDQDKADIAHRITTGKATPQDLIYASFLNANDYDYKLLENGAILAKPPLWATKSPVGYIQWLKNTYEKRAPLTKEQADEIIMYAHNIGLKIGKPELDDGRYGFHVNIMKSNGAAPNAHLPVPDDYKLPDGIIDNRPPKKF